MGEWVTNGIRTNLRLTSYQTDVINLYIDILSYGPSHVFILTRYAGFEIYTPIEMFRPFQAQ